MTFDLPDLQLSPDWENQRMKWKALAEECLYGHAPEKAEIKGTLVQSESLWNGAGKKETVRIA